MREGDEIQGRTEEESGFAYVWVFGVGLQRGSSERAFSVATKK